jgi:phosphoribosylanthranilate isomerase
MLKTKVKVSAIENLSDARYCAGMGVEWLGFSMTEVPVDKFNEIRNWLSGIQIVGEAFNCSDDQIIALCEAYQPDVLEINSSIQLEKIKHLILPKILRVNLDSDNLPALFAAARPYIDYFLLVGDSEDSLLGFEDQVEIWSAQYPIILGLSIPESDLDEWVEQSSIQGIGLIAGKEERPGYRDFTGLMTILEKLETE